MKALHEYMKYKKTYLVNDQSLSNTNNVHNEAYELQKKKKKRNMYEASFKCCAINGYQTYTQLHCLVKKIIWLMH